MKQSAIIIGSGIGGLATACLLAHDGWQVTLLEKNEQLGGRAGVFEAEGFRFDTGPSWYLMPEVFERFFTSLGENVTDHLQLVRLSPGYQVFFKDTSQTMDIYGDLPRDQQTFESFEAGAGNALKQYLQHSQELYDIATREFLYKNYSLPRDLFSPTLLRYANKLNVLSNMSGFVSKRFKSPELQKVLQYPSVFLGASPYNSPALYSFMSHLDFTQGVYYPKGGMYQVVRALEKIARDYGVDIHLDTPVDQIITTRHQAIGVQAKGQKLLADTVISNTDPHFTETKLLEPEDRDHSSKYWNGRTLSPSALLLYLGVDRRYDSLRHHNLLFSQNWRDNFDQLKQGSYHFPDDPSLYVCAPSRTDPTVAPKGQENLFVLVPLAAGLNYTPNQLEEYIDKILQTLESSLQLSGLRQHIVYQKHFCVKDFESHFNSFRGTGLGLAHTLKQTGPFRPNNRSKKVKGLYYVGANVHPGVGIPACLVSAELVRQRLL